ncbi:3-oxoadipate enol-lactonase [Frigidibacter sp. RF13]|uniref:3-oxoadipate enol-lactonase n=1 Tax=Frigidibacter sp. RF13 TaxID=2997340 RepID=UPI002270F75D|nr:3-oxoadipate enol-lactonase [Frigidibacter sp. RF13]MCY1128299.1 3-oxoadipate enol-lactonase [Frigidibacter sp. RF13]
MSEPRLHWQEEGDPKGAPVVFAHALGLDLRLWDKVLPLLPTGLRLIRFDLRGHGQSEVPPAPYAMGALVRDAEALLDRLEVLDCVFVGLSVGGLIAQGLAVKRLDMVRALVLSNTAAKIGTRAIWEGRVEAVRQGGITAIADATLERWFPKSFRDGPDGRLWRDRLLSTPVEGYIGVSAAIGGTDLITPTSGLRLPTLVLAGDRDGSTPPDLVRELADLIPGSDFRILRGAGHLPPVDQPEVFAAKLCDFLTRIGHSSS